MLRIHNDSLFLLTLLLILSSIKMGLLFKSFVISRTSDRTRRISHNIQERESKAESVTSFLLQSCLCLTLPVLPHLSS